MATFIDGIAASENIDSSGERISVAGMDISSLPVDGVFNYEHESKHPDQVIGKVLMAKKIFSVKDCENDRMKYFWDKCQTPYVYVMGELFDDYKESAKEVAGMFRYDSDKKDQNERNVMNFSIEGAKIAKEGINIVKSIARKVTITVLPCNKAAVAEMVPAKAAKPKNDLDSLFKSETDFQVELFKPVDMGAFLESIKKHANLALVKAEDPRGTSMGKTKSGQHVFTHGRIGEYSSFTHADHKDAMNMHYDAISRAPDAKLAQHHTNKMKLHQSAMHSAERRETRMARTTPGASTMRAAGTLQSKPSVHRPYAKVDDIKKTMTAGSSTGAPSTLQGGAATAKECLDPKMHKGCTHGPTLTKSEFWLERAEQEYSIWSQREHFEKFMSAKNPNMTKTEIKVIGQTMALKKAIEAEQALETMTKALTFGSPSQQAATAKFVEEQKNKPKAPKQEHKPEPELKGRVKTEVSHIESHLSPSVDHETVHLQSGHKVMGVKKGTHKVGDKVTVSAHPMGARVLTPGHE